MRTRRLLSPTFCTTDNGNVFNSALVLTLRYNDYRALLITGQFLFSLDGNNNNHKGVNKTTQQRQLSLLDDKTDHRAVRFGILRTIPSFSFTIVRFGFMKSAVTTAVAVHRIPVVKSCVRCPFVSVVYRVSFVSLCFHDTAARWITTVRSLFHYELSSVLVPSVRFGIPWSVGSHWHLLDRRQAVESGCKNIFRDVCFGKFVCVCSAKVNGKSCWLIDRMNCSVMVKVLSP